MQRPQLKSRMSSLTRPKEKLSIKWSRTLKRLVRNNRNNQTTSRNNRTKRSQIHYCHLRLRRHLVKIMIKVVRVTRIPKQQGSSNGDEWEGRHLK